MEENGSDGLDLYLYEVAMAFLEMTGRGCFLSPLELALVESWREREIPMAVLGRAFRKAGVGPGRPSSLVSLKRWVEKVDRARKRGKLAASAPLAEEDAWTCSLVTAALPLAGAASAPCAPTAKTRTPAAISAFIPYFMLISPCV